MGPSVSVEATLCHTLAFLHYEERSKAESGLPTASRHGWWTARSWVLRDRGEHTTLGAPSAGLGSA